MPDSDSHNIVATATKGRERVSPRVPGTPGGQERAVPSQGQGPYEGQARRARPVGLPHTPPQVSGVVVPQRAPEGDSFSAVLQHSLDAFASPFHERLCFWETARGASRRLRRRRGRLSPSSLDGEYSV